MSYGAQAKVCLAPGHDHSAAGPDRRSENMAVTFVVAHLGDQMLVALNERFGEVREDLVDGSVDARGVEVGPSGLQ